ncbi:MAG: nucleoside deaminase [bacterium]|nr:nucleoside deaminase [bacterium]
MSNKKPLFLLGIAAFFGLLLVLDNIPAYTARPASLQGLSKDDYYMAMAFAEIGKMTPEDGWPVGAVVVRDDKIIGRGSNRLFASNNPTQHAEYIAVDRSIKYIQKYYPEENYADFFKNATVYVTLEPCAMDTGKITMLRFKRLVFCDIDEDWGGFGDSTFIQDFPHKVEAATSTLSICKTLQEREGWNHPELWEMGRKYASSTSQIPSRLDRVIKKIY